MPTTQHHLQLFDSFLQHFYKNLAAPLTLNVWETQTSAGISGIVMVSENSNSLYAVVSCLTLSQHDGDTLIWKVVLVSLGFHVLKSGRSLEGGKILFPVKQTLIGSIINLHDPAEAGSGLRDQGHKFKKGYEYALFYEMMAFPFGFKGNIHCIKSHRCLNLSWTCSQNLNKEAKKMDQLYSREYTILQDRKR